MLKLPGRADASPSIMPSALAWFAIKSTIMGTDITHTIISTMSVRINDVPKRKP